MPSYSLREELRFLSEFLGVVLAEIEGFVLAVVKCEDVVGWLEFRYGYETDFVAVACGLESLVDVGYVFGEYFRPLGLDVHFSVRFCWV